MSDTQNILPEGEEPKKENVEDQTKVEASLEEEKAEPTLAAEEPETEKPEAEESEAEESKVEAAAEEAEAEAPAEAQVEVEAEAEKTDHLSDEDLEKGDDTAEVHADDDHEEDHHHELEMPDYGEFSNDDLIAAAEKLLKEQPIQKLKEHIDTIRKYLLKHLNDEKAEKLEEFIEQGGNALDFEYIQPLREKFRGIYQEYRKRRKKYYDDLSSQLDHNLLVKRNLIERLKELVNKEESIGETFKEFNEIQQEWRNTGAVPRQESGDLWRTYHFHVENFYEYIKINKELRDLDYKKNQNHKEELIQKAETILNGEDLREGFKELQKLHKEWRHVGPVEPELREVLWQKFSEITKQIHEKRESFFKELRAKREELLDQKKALVDKIKEVPRNHGKHHEWQKAIKMVNDIQSQFKKIGRLHIPGNDEVWEDFREALRDFNKAKNEFYKNLKKDHQENLEKKMALLAEAEALKDSEDWRNAANALKRIQADWKKIGHVPKSESDKIWKEFRAACNHFFNRLTNHNKNRDKKLAGNAEGKEKVIAALEDFSPDVKDKKATIAKVKEFISDWKSQGPIPQKMRGELDARFNKGIDAIFKAIDMDREESQRIRFENKMDSLAEEGEYKLQQERDHLRRKLDDSKKELIQLENNMSFFSSSDPKSPIVKDAQKNIEAQKNVVANLQGQVKMLTTKIKDLQKQEAAQEESQEASESENSGE